MKRLLPLFAMLCMAVSIQAQTVTLYGNVINGHDRSDNDIWTTWAVGMWKIVLSPNEQAEVSQVAQNAAMYGNCGAIHKDGYFWTFFGGEASSEDDPSNLDTEYGNEQQKIVVRKFDDKTWKQVGDAVTLSPNSGLTFTDLTYDANDDEVYCIYKQISGSGDNAFDSYRFGKLDLESLTITNLCDTAYYTELRALAAHPNGNLYAIDYSGYLYKVDKKKGVLTTVGHTGHRNQRRMQTMVADWRTGKLYFSGFMNDGKDHSREGNRYGTALYEVNIETAQLTEIFQWPYREEVVGLFIDGDIVKKAHDLGIKLSVPSQVKAGQAATVTANVKNLGTEVASGYNVNVYVNGQLAKSVAGESLAAGKSMAYDIDIDMSVGLGTSANIYASVEYTADENTKNNTTATETIAVIQTALPTVNLMGMTEGATLSLAWAAPALGQRITEDFERYAPFIINEIGDWTLVDRSGKQATVRMQSGLEGVYQYANAGRPFAWQVFNPKEAGLSEFYWGADTCTYYCQSGNQMLLAAAGAVPSSNEAGYEYVQGNEWLISPELSGNAQTISFYAKCWTSQVSYFGVYRHYPEQFNVLYSTTDTNPESFTAVNAAPVEAVQWFSEGVYSYELPAGAKYFAIQRVTDPSVVDMNQSNTFGEYINNGFFLYIDDISYIPAGVHLIGYNVYCNGVKLNSEPITDTDYTVADAQGDKTNVYSVSAVYEEGESAPSNAYTIIGTGVKSVTIDNNQLSDGVYDMSGRRMSDTQLPRGLYIIRRAGKAQKVMVK